MTNILGDLNDAARLHSISGLTTRTKKYSLRFLMCGAATTALNLLLSCWLVMEVALSLSLIFATAYLYILLQNELSDKTRCLFDIIASYFEELPCSDTAKKRAVEEASSYYRNESELPGSSDAIKHYGPLFLIFLTPLAALLYEIVALPKTVAEVKDYMTFQLAIYLTGTLACIGAYFVAVATADLLDYRKHRMKNIADALLSLKISYDMLQASEHSFPTEEPEQPVAGNEPNDFQVIT